MFLAAAGTFLVAKEVILPIALALIAKISWDNRQTKRAAREAANFVRPNGTGHPSLTALVEDILIKQVDQGREVTKKLENIEGKLDGHIESPGHKLNLELALEAQVAARELSSLVNEMLKMQVRHDPESEHS